MTALPAGAYRLEVVSCPWHEDATWLHPALVVHGGPHDGQPADLGVFWLSSSDRGRTFVEFLDGFGVTESGPIADLAEALIGRWADALVDAVHWNGEVVNRLVPRSLEYVGGGHAVVHRFGT